jgi:hypothetical protein
MRVVHQALLVFLFIIAAGGVATLSMGQETTGAGELIDTAGNIKVPSNYRTTYEYLGSWAVAAEKDQGSKQLHNVYGSPGTIEAFRKDGHFANGAVLVKEVFATRNDDMTTGTVSHADALQGWFVMIKESKNTHPENKLWGDGWIWSWFDAGNPTKTTSTDYVKDCKTCHVPAQATDWIYSSGYPPLKK